MATPRICSITSCDNKVFQRGWCGAHYQRWRAYGDPLAGGPMRNRGGGLCKSEGCERPSKNKGLCLAHYLRMRKHGDTLPHVPIRTGEKVPCKHAACEAESYCRGWCVKHYQRWMKHGDAEKTLIKMTKKGEPLRFFNEVLMSYEGGDCIDWPYAKIPAGYGQVWFEGKLELVTRLLCRIKNGPPPGEGYDAAHSCGNGHLGCSNHNHLSWKTRKENVADMKRHGTDNHWGHKTRRR